MQQNSDEINFLFPEYFQEETFRKINSLEPFSEEVIEYLNALSQLLNKREDARNYPDVATFAFFCRKANLLNLKKKHQSTQLKLGRGIVFHITPSNVPINFAYSMVAGLLAGNTNVVRVPSKNFEQVKIVCNAIKQLAKDEKYELVSNRSVYLQYERTGTATAYFSSFCDVRMIWGGDETIHQIRANQMPSRSTDITFADRYSICAIKAWEYLKDPAPEKTALHFFNDTYLFDQNACTAPHLMVWIGSEKEIEKAKQVFWTNFYQIVKSRYTMQPVIAVDKLTAFYNQAAQGKSAKKVLMEDNLIWRVEVKSLEKDIEDYRGTCGYFTEFSAVQLSEIAAIVNRKYQTLAYFGFSKEELEGFVKENKLAGIDRIVPIGKTTDFSLIWDGYGLMDVLSRNIEIV